MEPQMEVRIFGIEPGIAKQSLEVFSLDKLQETGEILQALLSPAALIAFAMSAWRLTADLGWTKNFAISDGLLSHWMIWLAIGIGLQMLASSVMRGRRA